MGQLYGKPDGGEFTLFNRVTVISNMSVKSKDINFYDGYGVRVAAYTYAEAANLTVLPAFPIREGITFTNWSKTLSAVKAATEPLDVFCVGGSADGKTKLFIGITSTLRATVPLFIIQSVSGGISIDWGDGSAAQTISGTGAVNTTHTYSAVGNYTVSLTVNSGTLGFGNNSASSVIGGSSTGYRLFITGCVIGSDISEIGRYAFIGCGNLMFCIIPQTILSVGINAFTSCTGLQFIGLPNEIVSVGSSAFSFCYSSKNAVFSSGMTTLDATLLRGGRSLENLNLPSISSIGEYALAELYKIPSLIIPGSVTNIGANAFNGCYALKIIKFKPTTPPTVADANAWTSIPSDCVFEMPSASLAAYQAATNYGPVVARMVGV